MPVTVHIHKRSGGEFLTTFENVGEKETIGDIKNRFMESNHYYPERQAWYVKSPDKSKDTRKADEECVSNLVDSGSDSVSLFFKDLGMQVSWRFVFVLEYFGPLLIFPLLYFLRPFIYDLSSYPSEEVFKLNQTQILGSTMVMLHFIKREFESLFVHRFSNATMPILRIPLNCGHYWVLCGLNIGYFLLHPQYQAPFEENYTVMAIISVIWLLSEIMNLLTHVHLRNLRPRGSKERKIPQGCGFDQVSCANYFWEIVGWTVFCVLTNTLTGWIFLIAATGQMTEWALKKHSNYKKQFPHYPKQRKALFPYLL